MKWSLPSQPLPKVGEHYMCGPFPPKEGSLKMYAHFTVVEVLPTGCIFLSPYNLDHARQVLEQEVKDKHGNPVSTYAYYWDERRQLFAVHVEWDAWRFKANRVV